MINLSRRQAMISAAGLGLSVNLLAKTAFAATGGRKLIFINCRGAMDGQSVSPPIGDPDYPDLRQGLILSDTALKLDSQFGLHPALTSVYALAQAGQARIAPAIATADRARSHFEAQDVLESGASVVYGASSGWLNRAVGALQAKGKLNALSIGATAPLVMRGPAEVSSWSPGGLVNPQARLPSLLMDLYRDDPLLGPAFARGLETEDMARQAMSDDASMMSAAPSDLKAKQGQDASRKLGDTVAGFMKEPGGPQIAAISLDGFDTHANQAGLIATRLNTLDAVIDGIQKGLGGEWANTVILVATEFGRTARVNGTGGTDHGTASTALVLGGGLKRGGIIGDWPTLKASALFENRDLAPTLDMRALFKGVLAEQMGLDRRVLDTAVFPDSAAIAPVSGLI